MSVNLKCLKTNKKTCWIFANKQQRHEWGNLVQSRNNVIDSVKANGFLAGFGLTKVYLFIWYSSGKHIYWWRNIAQTLVATGIYQPIRDSSEEIRQQLVIFRLKAQTPSFEEGKETIMRWQSPFFPLFFHFHLFIHAYQISISVNCFSQSLIICFLGERAPDWSLYLTSPLLSRSILRRCVLYFSRTTASARTAFSMMPRYLSDSCLSWTVSSADGFGVHLVVNRSLICVSWRSSSSIARVACEKQNVFH